jgi:hypothetical protein
MERESAAHSAKKRHPPVPQDQLPKLQKFSDITWIYWIHQARPENVRSLYTLWSLVITHKDSQRIIARVLKSANLKAAKYPGYIFSHETEQFRALLGNSSVSRISYVIY